MIFSKYLEENPNFWDSFPLLPSTVKSILEDVFYYRELCDKHRFNIYFRAKLNRKLDEFLVMYEKEMEFRGLDPFTLSNVERTIDTIKNKSIEDVLSSLRKFTGSSTETTAMNNSNDMTVTNDLTENQKKTGSDENKSVTDGSDTTSTEETTTDSSTKTDNETISTSDYPQSSPGLTDYLTSRTITDASSENQSSGSSDSSSTTSYGKEQTDTTTYDSTIVTTDTGTVTSNETATKEGTVSNESSSNLDYSKTSNAEEDTNINIVWKELKKGNFVDIYRNYYNIVSTLHAVDWLIKELDSCFLQVFDSYEVFELYRCSDTAELEEKINAVQEEVDALEVRVDDLEAGGGGGTGGVSKAYVDGKIDVVNEDIRELSNEITEIGGDLQEVNIYANSLNARLNTAESNISTVTQVAAANSAELATQQEQIDELDTRVDTLEAGGGGGGGTDTPDFVKIPILPEGTVLYEGTNSEGNTYRFVVRNRTEELGETHSYFLINTKTPFIIYTGLDSGTVESKYYLNLEDTEGNSFVGDFTVPSRIFSNFLISEDAFGFDPALKFRVSSFSGAFNLIMYDLMRGLIEEDIIRINPQASSIDINIVDGKLYLWFNASIASSGITSKYDKVSPIIFSQTT